MANGSSDELDLVTGEPTDISDELNLVTGAPDGDRRVVSEGPIQDQGKDVNWKHILGSGATNGALLAILMIALIALGDVVFRAFATAMLSFLAIILISPFLTRKIWERQFNVRPNWSHLIPVSFLTFFLPVLGPSFGGPSLSVLSYWLLLPVFAAAGGVLRSLPFAGWSYFKGSDQCGYWAVRRG